jgi:hypothetical protein
LRISEQGLPLEASSSLAATAPPPSAAPSSLVSLYLSLFFRELPFFFLAKASLLSVLLDWAWQGWAEMDGTRLIQLFRWLTNGTRLQFLWSGGEPISGGLRVG